MVGIMGRYLFLGNVFVLVVAFLASTPLPNLIWKKILVFGKKDKKKKIKNVWSEAEVQYLYSQPCS